MPTAPERNGPSSSGDGPRRRRSDASRLRAVILEALGWSPTRIARELGVVTSTVQRWLNPAIERRDYESNRAARLRIRGECVDCGAPTRWSGKGGRKTSLRCVECQRLRQITIDRDEVVRLRVDCGLSTSEIAAYLGASQPHVSTILRQLGMGVGRGTYLSRRRRYTVRGVTGYPINETYSGNSTTRQRTSYSVLDSEWQFREVATFYVEHVKGESRRRRLAFRECARLNAIDQLRELEATA